MIEKFRMFLQRYFPHCVIFLCLLYVGGVSSLPFLCGNKVGVALESKLYFVTLGVGVLGGIASTVIILEWIFRRPKPPS